MDNPAFVQAGQELAQFARLRFGDPVQRGSLQIGFAQDVGWPSGGLFAVPAEALWHRQSNQPAQGSILPPPEGTPIPAPRVVDIAFFDNAPIFKPYLAQGFVNPAVLQ